MDQRMTMKWAQGRSRLFVLAILAIALSAPVRANAQEEQKAFQAATQESDATAEAAKLESFLRQYPNSAFEENALEILLNFYSRRGGRNKSYATATRLLQKNPENLMALWVRVNVADDVSDECLELAKRGLRVLDALPKSIDGSTAVSEKQKSAMRTTFNLTAGSIYLKRKNFRDAQIYLRPAVDGDPNNFSGAYELALAYLLSDPPDPTNGLFFLARAWNLAPESGSAAEHIDAYGAKQCAKYFGTDRSWTSVKSIAKTETTPPPGFEVR
jgi:tetratricopeptide (TPR) repeat protein